MKRFIKQFTKKLLVFLLIAAILRSGCVAQAAEAKYGPCGVINYSAIPNGRAVPVLMYHALGEHTWGEEELYVSEQAFRQQLQYLRDNGYETIHFSDLNHLDAYSKPILLTFDDGYDNNYTNAYRILKEFQMKATFFVTTNVIGRKRYMTRQQLREISDSGLISVQSHAASHDPLDQMNIQQQTLQMQRSQQVIEEITGKKPYVLAYPYGAYNEDTLSIASTIYDMAVAINERRWTIDGQFYTISRHSMEKNTTMAKFIKNVSNDVDFIFRDVPTDAWYKSYVQNAFDRKIMCGMGENRFCPNESMTRAQMVQMLYNVASHPAEEAVSEEQRFEDVPKDQWFYPAVQWAVSNGISYGTSETTFEPNRYLSREEFVTMLYRAFGQPECSFDLSSYPDETQVSDWAYDAIGWAVAEGILNGMTVKGNPSNVLYLVPQGNATRAQAATVFAKAL